MREIVHDDITLDHMGMKWKLKEEADESCHSSVWSTERHGLKLTIKAARNPMNEMTEWVMTLKDSKDDVIDCRIYAMLSDALASAFYASKR